MSQLRIGCVFLIFTILIVPLQSLELDAALTPVAAIPVGADSSPYFTLGGGAVLTIGSRFFSFPLSSGLDFGYLVAPGKNTESFSQFAFLGPSLSYSMYPVSRLELRVTASGGLYEMFYKENTYTDLYWRIQGTIGFRISPFFTLAASAGFARFEQTFDTASEPMFTSILAGLSAQISFDTKKSTGNIDIEFEQYESIFPLFYGMYKDVPIGTVKITNNESAEIRNIRASFTAGNYTSSVLLCGSQEMLRKRKQFEVSLLADFSSLVLNFTENGKIPGELVIEYELLGSKKTISKTLVVSIYNRNTVRWTDTASLAAFISPTANEVLDLSKFLVGIARDNLRSGLNRNMQFAMYVFEGLKIGGLTVAADSGTPYTTYSLDPSLLDYIQYPFQTLAYASGDLDEVGLLYAALLESVGIKAAIIPLSNDFLVLFNLGIENSAASNLFNSLDNLLEIDGTMWMPLSMKVFREGFINSWFTGISSITNAINSAEEIDLVILQDAWTRYPPAGFTTNEAQFQKPLEASVVREAETNMRRYISSEFGPKIQVLQQKIKSEGASVQSYNDLGLVYVRAGMFPEAKSEYLKAAKLGSTSAMINLGNIAHLEKDFHGAVKWFSEVLAIQSENQTALNGLSRAKIELSE